MFLRVFLLVWVIFLSGLGGPTVSKLGFPFYIPYLACCGLGGFAAGRVMADYRNNREL